MTFLWIIIGEHSLKYCIIYRPSLRHYRQTSPVNNLRVRTPATMLLDAPVDELIDGSVKVFEFININIYLEGGNGNASS